jgi:prolyl 4-hydroxylase
VGEPKQAVLTPTRLCRSQVLSWTPRIFLLHDLLTAEECDHLRSLAAPELEASTVVDTATGEGKLSAVRTSSGMFITENTDITERIRARIAHITLLPGASAQ